MSAIAGVFGRRNPAEWVSTMLAALAARGRTGHSIRPIGKGDDAAVGHAGRVATPASLGEHRPFTHHESGCVITADIRLDNRPELLADLALDAGVGDAELALRAYLRWGLSFPHRLLGAFAIGIWDPRSESLHLARDHFGVRPLVYASTDDSMVFGSSVQAVRVASPNQHPVYTDKLLHLLVDPLEAGEPLTTVFRGIHRVPAASVLTWRPAARLKTHRYWSIEQPAELTLKSDAEYAEAFAEVLTEAVACRLAATTPVSSMLSGGLDSSAVTTIAADLLSTPLRTYSAVEDKPLPVSDTPAINAMISHLPIDAVRITQGEIAAQVDLDAVLADPEALFDCSMVTAWCAARHADRSGHRVMLTGVGGDELLHTAPVNVVAALLQHGRLRQALREAGQVNGKQVPKRTSLRGLPARYAPAVLRHGAGRRRYEHAVGDYVRSCGVDPDHSAAERLRQLLIATAYDPYWSTKHRQLNGLRRPFLLVALERYDRVGARHNVEIRHPFIDKRLVLFCLSLPPTQLQRNGWSKWILRKVLTRHIPAEVAWRPKEDGVLGTFWEAVTSAHCQRWADDRLDREIAGSVGLSRDQSGVDPFHRQLLAHWWQRHGD